MEIETLNANLNKNYLGNPIFSFLNWVNKNGYSSYDQYDFWNTWYGKLAKRVYYKKHTLGAPLVLPVFVIELLCPSLRALHSRFAGRHRRRGQPYRAD